MITTLKEQKSSKLLANNYIGHLAYVYRNRPFIVPITYFFDSKNTIIGYSTRGHKTMAMEKNSNVALEVVEVDKNNQWNSVVVHGVFEEFSGPNAKKKLRDFSNGIKDLILRKEAQKLRFISDFSGPSYKDNFIVFKIIIDEITLDIS